MMEKLSRREREILDVLYALGDSADAEQIRERLSDPPSYSAVRAMLAKLEAKGVIRHRAEGLRYIYSPVTSRSAAQKKAVSNLMKVFFGGSASEAAAALIKQEQWSDEELDALRKQIDDARRSRRKS
ncbi:MAG TPA: BlaI/MecI/CopY family transcriptional regulator [Vicinamibacterales bacterium]|nr:BlaI/MecI/CopY family transcriptional regulator [Vicinamibacterales bacterium]